MKPIIEFTNVSKSYKDKLILRDINMTFSSGEFVAIIGSSGCGKTTLLKMINKLLPMDRGDIIIDGKSIREIPDIKLRREIGYVVQEGGLFPHFTVKENLEIVPQLEGLEPEKREQRINELLDMVNLDPSCTATAIHVSFPADSAREWELPGHLPQILI